jgi:hypothetical protein
LRNRFLLFIALPDREKNRIFAEIAAETPEHRLGNFRPLNKAERAEWRKMKRSELFAAGVARMIGVK